MRIRRAGSLLTTLLAACNGDSDEAAPRVPAPRGVWYEAPRPEDPPATVMLGRDVEEVRYILEVTGSGVGLIDYDRDGDLDVYVPMAWPLEDAGDATTDRLYRNRGDGTFEDVTEAAGITEHGFGMGVAVGDYDRDGFDDLFVTNWGPDRLLRNRGDGTFEDATAAAGVGDPSWSTSAAFGDPDGDGDLDLYVCRYIAMDLENPPNGGRPCPTLGRELPCGPKGLPPEHDLFWRNEGDGTFTERSQQAGMRDVPPSYGLGVTFFDLEGDGRLDLFVGNDSVPNFVFRNRGDGTFEEVGAVSGLSANIDGREQACMGVDVGDVDGDGREELVVTNFSSDYNTLYKNDGDGFYTDVTRILGLGELDWWTLGWGTRLFDADCDRDLDLFVANGHIYPTDEGGATPITYEQRNHLWLQSEGRFDLVSDQAGPGLALVKSSRGVAFGDLDRDGWIDLVVIDRNEPLSILRAVPQPGVHRLLVELLPGPDRRPVDHSVVVVRAGGTSMMRRMNRGGSYASSNDPRVHFGLGDAAVVDELTVRWPDGTVSAWKDVPVDSLVTVRRGAATLEAAPLR